MTFFKDEEIILPPENERYYKAVLFDLNGTLIEIFRISEYMGQLKEMIDVLEFDHDPFVEAWKRTWNQFEFGDYPSVEHRIKEAIKLYYGKLGLSIDEYHEALQARIDKAAQIRLDYMLSQLNKVKPYVFEVVNWLRDLGYKTGVISNCSMETSILWKKSRLNSLFPNPTLSCEIKIKKPNEGIFRNEIEKIGVEADRCIYIADGDDSEMDTAASMGMTPVLITYDLSDTYRHKGFPDIEPRIECFSELPRVVAELEERMRARK